MSLGDNDREASKSVTARDMHQAAATSTSSDGQMGPTTASPEALHRPLPDDDAADDDEDEDEERDEEEALEEAQEEDGRAHPFSRSKSHPKPEDLVDDAGASSKPAHSFMSSLFHSHRTPDIGEPSTPRKVASGRHGIPMTPTISFRDGETPKRRGRRAVHAGGDEDDAEEEAASLHDGWTRSPDSTRRGFGLPLSTTWSRSSTVATTDTAESYQPRFGPPGRMLQGLRNRGVRRRRRDAATDAAADEDDAADAAVEHVAKIRGMPVFSGLLAPFSIMLEVPGLTSKWYLRVGGGFYRQNPVILDVGLAISMASAVVANIAIVARFTGRACPRKATLIAIACFLLHDAINIVALAVFGVIHAVNDGFTYSEAFWMTAGSTFASVLCTVTLLIDYIGTKDFRNSGSGLTPAQTRLVIVVMLFLVFLSIGSMIYALLLPLVFLDAVYYFMTTIATVGLGDIVPKTVAERVILFFLAPIGIVMLAILVTTARETLMEEFEAQYKRRAVKFKRKQQERLAARQLNRRAIKEIKRGYGRGGTATSGLPTASLLFPALSPSSPFGGALSEKGTGKSPAQHEFEQLSPLSSLEGLKQRWYMGFARQPKRSDESASANAGQRSAKSSETAAESSSTSSGEKVATAEEAAATHDVANEMARMEAQLLAQREALDKEWNEFKERLDSSEKRDFWVKLVLTFTLFFAFWMIGAGVFHATEKWTFFECLYFTFIVFSTIGYGDYTPKTPAGRAFFIVWALLGVGILTIMFAVLSDAWGNALKRGATGASFENLVQRKKIKAARRDHPRAEPESKKPLAAMRRGLRRLTGDAREMDTATQTGDAAVATAAPPRTSPTIAPAILEAMAPVAQTTLPHDAELAVPPPSASILRSPATETTAIESPRGAEAALTFAEPPSELSAAAAAEATPDDVAIHDMPLALARSAMSVHQHIIAYNKTQRRLVLDTIRSVPELAHLLLSEMAEHQPSAANTAATPATTTTISAQHKEKLLSAARSFHDPAAEAAVAGWIEMRQFEDELHGLIAKTAALREEMLHRQHRLDASRERIEELERRLEEVGHDGTEEGDDLTDGETDDEDGEHDDDEVEDERDAAPRRIEEA